MYTKQMHGVATAHMVLPSHVGNGPDFLRSGVHSQFGSSFPHHHARTLSMDHSDLQNRPRYSMQPDMSFPSSLYSSNKQDVSPPASATTGSSTHGDRTRPTPILPPFQTQHTKINQLPPFEEAASGDPVTEQWRRPTNVPETNSNANPIYDITYMTESRQIDELEIVPNRINSTGVRSPGRSDSGMLNSGLTMDNSSGQTAISFYSNRPVSGFEPGNASYPNGFSSMPSTEYQPPLTMTESHSAPTVSVMNHQQEANGSTVHSHTINTPVIPSVVPRRPSIPAPHMMSTFSAKVVTSTPKRYKCTVCSKRFTRPSSLTTHMYSHTGEKPYKCMAEGCGRHFSVVSNLRRHTKIHNASTP